jgi:ankyrin repeat protein
MSVRPTGSSSIPANPHPDWYRKAAKRRLAELRAQDPKATLSQAQFAIAREHGCSSWRALVAAIAERRGRPLDAPPDALFAAITARDHARVRQLLDQGIDLEQRHGNGSHTALSWAVTIAAFDLAGLLVEAGAQTDLYCAAAMGDLPGVRSFFDAAGRPTDAAAYTCERRPLSHVTPRHQRPDTRDVVSEAMFAAVRHGHVDVATYLADRGVDVHARVFHGATLLHWAYYSGSQPLIDLLLAHGADPSAEDRTFDCTPRAFAICALARVGSVTEVAERLAADPSLATINEGRGTPLHEAARARNEAVVRLLLEHGADPAARDRNGLTPRDLAGDVAWAEVLA